MISIRGMYMRNTTDITPNREYIRNADMSELSEMSAVALGRFINKVISIILWRCWK